MEEIDYLWKKLREATEKYFELKELSIETYIRLQEKDLPSRSDFLNVNQRICKQGAVQEKRIKLIQERLHALYFDINKIAEYNPTKKEIIESVIGE